VQVDFIGMEENYLSSMFYPRRTPFLPHDALYLDHPHAASRQNRQEAQLSRRWQTAPRCIHGCALRTVLACSAVTYSASRPWAGVAGQSQVCNF